jgi:hypothetical protein
VASLTADMLSLTSHTTDAIAKWPHSAIVVHLKPKYANRDNNVVVNFKDEH